MINSNEIIEVLDVLINKTLNKEIEWKRDGGTHYALVNGNKIGIYKIICYSRSGNYKYSYTFSINHCAIFYKSETEANMLCKVSWKIEELYNNILASYISSKAEIQFSEFRKICLIEQLAGLDEDDG